MILLLLSPAYIWFKLYHGRGFKVSRFEIASFFTALTVLILAPAFKIQQISAKGLMGVDILTQEALSNALVPHQIIFLASLAVLLFVSFISKDHLVKGLLLLLSITAVIIFFAYYIFIFFFNVTAYYLKTIAFLVTNTEFLIAFYLFIFLAINIILYVGGFFIFVIETKNEFRHIR